MMNLYRQQRFAMSLFPKRSLFMMQQTPTPILFTQEPIMPFWEPTDDLEEIYMKGRNSRMPKKANHGARPCSSYMRKLKKKGYYHKVRGE